MEKKKKMKNSDKIGDLLWAILTSVIAFSLMTLIGTEDKHLLFMMTAVTYLFYRIENLEKNKK
jgi:hypothetical protein